MKKLYVILLFSVFASCAAKLIQIDSIEKTFKAPGDKTELYIKANNWMVENFTNAKSVIQFSDKEEGIVTGKYFLRRSHTPRSGLTSTFAIIKLEVKDYSSKITITPEAFYAHSSAIYQENFRYKLGDVEKEIENLILSYEEYLNRPTDQW